MHYAYKIAIGSILLMGVLIWRHGRSYRHPRLNTCGRKAMAGLEFEESPDPYENGETPEFGRDSWDTLEF